MRVPTIKFSKGYTADANFGSVVENWDELPEGSLYLLQLFNFNNKTCSMLIT